MQKEATEQGEAARLENDTQQEEAIARRSCLYKDDGCTWKTPKCDQTVAKDELELYVDSHSKQCIHNQVSAEKRSNKRKREAAETASLWAAEDEATKLRCADNDGRTDGQGMSQGQDPNDPQVHLIQLVHVWRNDKCRRTPASDHPNHNFV